MRIMRYILAELSSFPVIRICLVAILGIACFNTVQFADSYFNYSDNQKMIKEKIGSQAVYRMIESHDDYFSSEANAGIVQEVGRKLSKKPYYFIEGTGYFTEDKKAFFINTDSEELISSKGSPVYRPHLVIMNQALLKKEKIVTQFSQKDFTGETNGVLLGNNYRQKYRVGETIKLSRPKAYSAIGSVSLEQQNFVVKGFLPKAKKMLDYSQGGTILLDSYIVVPLSQKMEQGAYDRFEMTQMMSYFFLLSKKQDQQVSYLDLFKEIREIGAKYKMPNIQFQNDQVQYFYELQGYEYTFTSQAAMLILFFGFSIMQLGIIIYFLYQKRQSVYEVYYAIGSTRKEIFNVLFLSHSTLLVIAVAGLLLLNKFYLTKDWSIEAIVCGAGVFFATHLLMIWFAVGRKRLSVKRRSKK